MSMFKNRTINHRVQRKQAPVHGAGASRVVAFYLGPEHLAAIDAWRQVRGLSSASAALRDAIDRFLLEVDAPSEPR